MAYIGFCWQEASRRLHEQLAPRITPVFKPAAGARAQMSLSMDVNLDAMQRRTQCKPMAPPKHLQTACHRLRSLLEGLGHGRARARVQTWTSAPGESVQPSFSQTKHKRQVGRCQNQPEQTAFHHVQKACGGARASDF